MVGPVVTYLGSLCVRQTGGVHRGLGITERLSRSNQRSPGLGSLGTG